MLDEILDVVGEHSPGIEDEDLVVEAVEATLILADQLRFEGAVSVAWDVHGDLPQVALDGHSRASVSSAAGRVWWLLRQGLQFSGGSLLASEVDIHLGIEHGLESGLHESAQEDVEFVDGIGLRGEFFGHPFGLGRQLRIRAIISVKKVGWENYSVLPPDTRFLTGPVGGHLGHVVGVGEALGGFGLQVLQQVGPIEPGEPLVVVLLLETRQLRGEGVIVPGRDRLRRVVGRAGGSQLGRRVAPCNVNRGLRPGTS